MLDSQDSGLSDVPNYDGSEDEAFPPLPPPHSPGQRGALENDGPFQDGEDGEMSKLADVPAAKRRGVKRPQPKLDSQRLISDRGLPALRTLFDNVRFKGKGHEAEDLRLLMQKMENWAHRLYPRLQFEEFINKVEKLGGKKEVQTCLKRIRLDMPLTHEDFMDKDGEEVPPELQGFGHPDPFTSESFVSDTQRPVHSTPAPPNSAAPSLTEEQRRRMELNRERALERRLARQQQHQQADSSDSQTVDMSPLVNKPTSGSSSNVLSDSTIQDEKMEGLDLEPSSSSTQEPNQPPTTDLESLSAATEESSTETSKEPPTKSLSEDTTTEGVIEAPKESPMKTPTEVPIEESQTEGPAEAPKKCPTGAPKESPTNVPIVSSAEVPVEESQTEGPAEAPKKSPTGAPKESPTNVPVVSSAEVPVEESPTEPHEDGKGSCPNPELQFKECEEEE